MRRGITREKLPKQESSQNLILDPLPTMNLQGGKAWTLWQYHQKALTSSLHPRVSIPIITMQTICTLNDRVTKRSLSIRESPWPLCSRKALIWTKTNPTPPHTKKKTENLSIHMTANKITTTTPFVNFFIQKPKRIDINGLKMKHL